MMDETDIPTEDTKGLSEPYKAENNGASPDLLWINEGQDCVVSTIYVYQDSTTKRLRTILWEPSPELVSIGMVEFPVETKWSVPSKTQLNDYRDKSSRYNTVARAFMIQKGRLEEFLIQNHLLEMRLGSGEHRVEVELHRDKRGLLTAETMGHINKLHPSVMEMVFAKFIDESALNF